MVNEQKMDDKEYCIKGFFDVVCSVLDFRGRTPLKLGLNWATSETDYLALSALNVKNEGIVSVENVHYGTKELYDQWMGKNTLRKGQIVMTTEAPAGVVMQVPDNRPYILSQRVIALNLRSNVIDETYFAYLLRSPFIQQQLERLCSGGTAKGISQKVLSEIKVKYPASKREQQKIATFFTTLDEKISIATKKLFHFKNLKKEIARSLFEDCAVEDFKKIGDFARTFAGATPATSHKEYWENGTIPWMSSGEINNRYIHSVEKRITTLGFEKTSTKWVKKGSTLVALAGQGKTRGKVAFTEMELCTNQSLAAIECDREEVNDKYLFFFLETQYENLRAQSTGDGGRGGLNLFIINNFEVPILPRHEQVRIVSILELIDKKVELAENKLLVLEQVKRAFMQQRFV